MSKDSDIVYSFFWNNPFNLYSLTEKPTKESMTMQAVWQLPPVLGYAAAVATGAEVAGFVGFWSVPTILGATAMTTFYLFGAVSAAAMVYDVRTDPVKQAQLETFASPGVDIFRTTGFGGMSV